MPCPVPIARLAFAALAAGCALSPQEAAKEAYVQDPHSLSNPIEVRVRHLDLDLAVSFTDRSLRGLAVWEITPGAGSAALRLDTRGLAIEAVEVASDGKFHAASHTFGPQDSFLGRALVVDLPAGARRVAIRYRTAPDAAALQWLEPRQTAGGTLPFLFTQSQAILARTWIPCQDSPSVRFTYRARVVVPKGLTPVMSAGRAASFELPGGLDASLADPSGDAFCFDMPQAIPSYLMALAVGELAFEPVSERCGIYAEPSVVKKAAWEFADVEKMVLAAERLYGPYRWGRYDVLVLPASFPFGGMENPRLTFATPTVIAGDRSLVALVAHELAHSWSGNLVTNATWNDFWLNEGFTVYFENRIMEELYGRERSEMLASLGRTDLDEELRKLGPGSPDSRLKLDLAGRDPDDAVNAVAYDKGYFFLRCCEEAVGREVWDGFLRQYFERFAFQSLTTERFLGELKSRLLAPGSGLEAKVGANEWVYGTGLPDSVPKVESSAFARVDAEAQRWTAGAGADSLAAASWTAQEQVRFLQRLSPPLSAERLADLDTKFGLTRSGNAEILCQWLQIAIESRWEPAYASLEEFLVRVGRRKLVRPLYERLVKTPEGKALALRIYERARPGYHAVTSGTIDKILGRGA